MRVDRSLLRLYLRASSVGNVLTHKRREVQGGTKTECEERNRMFSQYLFVTFFSNLGGGSTQLLMKDPEKAKLFGDPAFQEVTVYGKFAQNHARIKDQILLFEPEWHTLLIGAIDWSDVWFEAVSLHELFHAKFLREGSASATALPASDLYMQEEVAAHDLEHAVLNLRTEGKYYAVIQKILDGKIAATREQLIAGIKAEDLALLNALFELVGFCEMGIRLTQYWLSLLNGWVERQSFKANELTRQKIANYRFLVSSGNE